MCFVFPFGALPRRFRSLRGVSVPGGRRHRRMHAYRFTKLGLRWQVHQMYPYRMTSEPQPEPRWPKLKEYDLYQLDRPVAGPPTSIRACAVLPYVALPPGSQPFAEWNVLGVREHYRGDRIMVLQGIDWLIANRVDVIDLSIGFHQPHDPLDPLHVATKAAADHGINVVVSAGNDGPRPDSLQELARDPWVISVGATDRDGQLLRSSSRGSPLVPGPTVVADGTPERLRQNTLVDFTKPQVGGEPTVKSIPKMEPGTSFAVPRVGNAVIFIRKMLEITWALYQACLKGLDQVAIALPVLGVADTGIDPDFMLDDAGPYRRQLLAAHQEQIELPVRGAARDWFGNLASRLTAAGGATGESSDASAAPLTSTEPHGTPGIDMARRVLCSAATEIAAERWAAGAGLISRDALERYFAAFGPSQFAGLFLPRTQSVLGAEGLAAIDSELGTLWSDRDIEYLADVFSTGVFLAVVKVI
jgi:hypothetical protein